MKHLDKQLGRVFTRLTAAAALTLPPALQYSGQQFARVLQVLARYWLPERDGLFLVFTG